MRNKLILTAAAAALAVPAMAQVGADVGATTDASVGAEAPASGTLDTVQDTVGTATDTAQDTVNTATDTATGVADQATGATTGATAATAADVQAGAEVRDTDGNVVGTIESVDANGAVIATGEARVQIPVSSFAKDDKGLVIAMTKAELEAAAKAAAEPS
ncbi:hypothetical protein [Sphingosinicella humi]|uniref:PRC-barrel domain-containing protein n=1 Tax=Allosphingosinicella humi TaxID=2068657 RepID=A0A2U2J2M8_9SPHN|nr:hypothetical protein [Sphingosinicella humi]PWG02600.1 hypothetical protein DF286_06765 [Sphingosinicella humi]